MTQEEVVEIAMCLEATPGGGRDVDRFGTGAVTTGQPDDAIARYG
jgi:hypothetical protein